MKVLISFLIGVVLGGAAIVGWHHASQPSEHIVALEQLERDEAERDEAHRQALAAARQR